MEVLRRLEDIITGRNIYKEYADIPIICSKDNNIQIFYIPAHYGYPEQRFLTVYNFAKPEIKAFSEKEVNKNALCNVFKRQLKLIRPIKHYTGQAILYWEGEIEDIFIPVKDVELDKFYKIANNLLEEKNIILLNDSENNKEKIDILNTI